MMLVSHSYRMVAAAPGILSELTAGRRGDRCEASCVYALFKEVNKIFTKTSLAYFYLCFIAQNCVTLLPISAREAKKLNI